MHHSTNSSNTQNLEDLIIQNMSLSEIITFKILKNYQKIIFLNFLSLLLIFFSNPILKSSGIVGIILTSSFLSYVHIRFGSIVFSLVMALIATMALYYLAFNF
jgi:hypothetical protein